MKDGERTPLDSSPAIAWLRRTLGVLVLAVFLFTPWCRDYPREWGATGLRFLGQELLGGSRSFTLPGRVLLESTSAIDREDAVLTLARGAKAILFGFVIVAGIALVVVPRSPRVVRLATVSGAASMISITLWLALGLGAVNRRAFHALFMANLELLFGILIPHLATAATLYGQLTRSSRLERRAMALLVGGALLSTPLHGRYIDWEIHWGLRVELVLLSLALLLTRIDGTNADPEGTDESPSELSTTGRQSRIASTLSLAIFFSSLVLFAALTKRALTLKLAWSDDLLSVFYRPPTHEAVVVEVAFSPRGELLATLDADGSVKVWSAADGTLQRELAIKTSSAEQIHALRFTSSGSLIAAAPCPMQCALGVFRINDGDISLVTLPLACAPAPNVAYYAAALSPSGDILADNCDGSIRLRRVTDGSEVCKIATRQSLAQFAFSPDGALIAVEDANGVEIRLVRDGSLVRTVAPRDDAHGRARPSFYGGGQILVHDRFHPDSNETSWVLRSIPGNVEGEDIGTSDRLASPLVELAPEGHRLEPAGEGKGLGFRAKNGSLVRLSILHEYHERVVFSPDERVVALVDGSDVVLCRLP